MTRPTLTAMISAVRALSDDGADGVEIADALTRAFPTATSAQRRRAMGGR